MIPVVATKWIEGVSAGHRTGDVAVRTLQYRLGKLVQLVSTASAEQSGKSVEVIHELRIWSRRASAALDLYQDLIPHRTSEWVNRQLRRIRKATNAARDCDVLIGRLKSKPPTKGNLLWLRKLCAERKKAEASIDRLLKRLEAKNRFARRIDRLIQKVQARSMTRSGIAELRFEDWAQTRLQPLIGRFFKVVPSDRTDVAGLHRFRIRGKKLRYAMELLEAAYPDEFRKRLYPSIEAMQDRLGRINDLSSSKEWLLRRMRKASEEKAKTWRNLLTSEQTKLDRSLKSFWTWCSPRKLRALQERFEAVKKPAA